jgi:hypothetical protein
MTTERCLRFVPSRVEGLPEVTEVAVYPDRLELLSDGRWVVYPFAAMVRWLPPAWLWRGLYRLGRRRRCLPVGDRDWFHPPPDRFFAFYTNPKLVLYMPDDECEGPREATYFAEVQEILRAGGFGTFDLG